MAGFKRGVYRIRVEWGGMTSYVDKDRFTLCWDGSVDVERGELKALYEIDPASRRSGHFFMGHALRRLDGHRWRSRTTQGLGGVVMEVEGADDCTVEVRTVQKTIHFTLGEVLSQRFMRWPVGAKYSGFSITAARDGDGPFAVDAEVDEGCLDVHVSAADFRGATRYGIFVDNHAAWLAPGQEVDAEVVLPRPAINERARRSSMLLELRLSLSDSIESDELDDTQYSPVSVRVNDTKVKSDPVYFRTGWAHWVECAPVQIPVSVLRDRENRIAIRNDSDSKVLAVMSAQLREKIETDLQIVSAPRWLLAGDRYVVKLRCLQPHADVRVSCRGGTFDGPAAMDLEAGVRRLAFVAGDGPEPLSIKIRDESGRGPDLAIPVYALRREEHTWKVGGILQCVNHDEASGEVDYVIDYTYDTQMGNYLQFRPEPSTTSRGNYGNVSLARWRHWAERLKERDTYFSFISGHVWRGYNLDGWAPNPEIHDIGRVMKEAAGDYLFSAHVHEQARWVYGRMPDMDAESWTMKDARDAYVRYVSEIELLEGVPRQTGEAVPLMSYDYEGGMDIIAAETMGLNCMQLLAAMRGASRAYGKPVWGCHNATYWAKAPDDFTKLTLNWLNFYMTYTTGGNVAISEDGHFHIPHSNYQAGFHSEETARLRQMLRRFYKYVNTHPRRGRPEVRMALAQGNLSCEILSFPLDFCWLKNQIGHIWGGFGSKHEPEKWRLSDAERGVALIDEWMPYWQDGQHIRHWFSGTPYGQFDIPPVWKADQEQLRDYRTLVFLGWNTMTSEMYDKLKRYVEEGGTLFMAVPHLSMHEDRAFLETMQELNLVREGDVSDLFGLVLEGPGEDVKGSDPCWADRDEAAPLDAPWGKSCRANGAKVLRTASVRLQGAKVLAREAKTGEPLLTEYSVGKGRALLLTAWAYPGHEALDSLVRDVLAVLGKQSASEVRLDDPSREVAWYVWRDDQGLRNIYLVNTDWTEAGNTKPCRLSLGGHDMSVDVREGRLTTVTWLGPLAVCPHDQDVYVEEVSPVREGRVRVVLHGEGEQSVHLSGLGACVSGIRSGDTELPFIDDGQGGRAEVRVVFGDRTRVELEVTLAPSARRSHQGRG